MRSSSVKPFARRTMRPEVLAGIGGFGALCEIREVPPPGAGLRHRRRRPKQKLAFELDRHDTVGIDLVAMSVNDVLVRAEPLFFLDYSRAASSNGVAAEVVKGIARGCSAAAR